MNAQYLEHIYDYIENTSVFEENQEEGHAYYLASPLNLFLVFCNRQYLLEFMSVLILIKTGLSGFSTAAYVRGHFGTKSPAALFPAVLYAMSAYMAAYYWNIMWLDSVALFPLILLGMERMIRQKKSLLFVVSFGLSVWCNYYISFMIAIFLFLWFFIVTAEWRLSAKERVTGFLRTLFFSVLSGGVSAVLLLPEVRLLAQSGVSGDAFPDSLSWYNNAADVAGQFFFLSPAVTTEGELPNLFCGSAVLFFCLLYVCNRRIRPGVKIAKLALLAFFLLSFNLNVLDYLWHGMHFPEGLPARQSFLCIFLLLMMACEMLLKPGGNRKTDAIIAGAGCIGLFIVVALFGTQEKRLISVAGTVLFLAAEALFFALAVTGEKTRRMVFAFAALVVVVAESAIHFEETGFSTTSHPFSLASNDVALNIILFIGLLVKPQCLSQKSECLSRSDRSTAGPGSLLLPDGKIRTADEGRELSFRISCGHALFFPDQ